MELPQRKPTRLKDYDYSSEGAYFITICTKNKQKILCDIVGDGVHDIPQTNLFQYGNIADKYIQKLSSQYDNICVDKYVIMPNHIHLIIKIFESTENERILNGTSQAPNGTSQAPNGTSQAPNGTSQAPSPTNAIVPKFVSLYKRYCNREIGVNIFQRSFYDHIIRDEKDYLKIWNYIDINSQKWSEDCFYIE